LPGVAETWAPERTEPPRHYFEDVKVGVPLETPGFTVTQTHLALFGGLVGDQAAAADPVVPDLLPLCISSGLTWRLPTAPLAVLAFVGFEWRFLLPVHVGDTIRSRTWTTTKRSVREGGIVIEGREILNQRDQVVQAGKITLLVAKRPPEGAARA